jgi:hypothetical protein
MAFAPINFVIEAPLPPKGTISIPYPPGRNEGHFFGGINHTLSIEGVFFRSPRDFMLITLPDRINFVWNGAFALPVGTLLNIQADMPAGESYFDSKNNVTVLGMIQAPLFMVNLACPVAASESYWIEAAAISDAQPLKLAHTQTPVARNVILYTDSDNSHTTFTIEGEDMYRRPMIEKIIPTASQATKGRKAFSRIQRITSSHACTGKVSIGTGNRIGLPVFLPSPGYVMREIIGGETVTGGTIVAGEVALPTATTGDRRGTYTPPANITLDGKLSIHLLISLIAPSNIGIPDYAG